MAVGMNAMSSLKNNECVYDSLPLYHSAGGILGASQAIIFGVTVALRKKFSARNFWTDCAKYKCNVSLTIVVLFWNILNRFFAFRLLNI